MTKTTEQELYLAPTHYIDSDSDAIKAFVAKAFAELPADTNDTSKAICLFDAVRDGLRYDPYSFDAAPQTYRASTIALAERAFCVPKAILLTAALRHAEIPAALGFADVRNHLSTPKLAEMMGTDLFVFHGYVKLWLERKEFKVTPAFNAEMCTRFGVKPLVFDGTGDALFHDYDLQNNRHMEYVYDRGLFREFPMQQFLEVFQSHYPRLVDLSTSVPRLT